MTIMAKRLHTSCVVVMFGVGWVISTSGDTCCAAPSQQSLHWSLYGSKDAYYPGEPVLLTLRIRNNSNQQEGVNFEGLAPVSSAEIRDTSGEVLSKGSSPRRPEGGLRPGPLRISPGQTSEKSTVLNRLCSTLLLPPGNYDVVCQLRYQLRSEIQGPPDTAVRKPGPLHMSEFRLKMKIAPMDLRKFEEILAELHAQAFPTPRSKKVPTIDEQRVAQEMLATTESTLGVPYQLELLAAGIQTAEAWGPAIASLARSKTLEAATGLMQLAEKQEFEGLRGRLVECVYQARENGQPEVISATDTFIQKYKRPAPLH